MNSVRLVSAQAEQAGLIKMMMQRYLAEFAEFTDVETTVDGQFIYLYFDHYWQSTDRYPYIIFFQDQIVGFCLVRDYQDPVKGLRYKELAEVFIEEPYRRQGIGEAAFSQLINLQPDVWRVSVLEANRVGRDFWNKVLAPLAGISKEVQFPADQKSNIRSLEHVYWLKPVAEPQPG